MPTPPSPAKQSPAKSRPAFLGWLLLGVLLLAAILIPWVLFDVPISRALTSLFALANAHPWQSAFLIIVLLAGDVLMPIPSSLVGVFSGSALGFLPGAAALWTGLMAGCLFGHWLGGRPGRSFAIRIVGAAQLTSLEALFGRLGPAMLIITRAVPVLAEASVIAAGAARMRLMPFLITTAFANLGVALAWAGIGSTAAATGSFLMVFLGLALLPALGWALWQRLRRNASSSEHPS